MTINNLIVTFVFIFNNVNIIHFNLETKNTDIGITWNNGLSASLAGHNSD
jgi:hypothetical protein